MKTYPNVSWLVRVLRSRSLTKWMLNESAHLNLKLCWLASFLRLIQAITKNPQHQQTIRYHHVHLLRWHVKDLGYTVHRPTLRRRPPPFNPTHCPDVLSWRSRPFRTCSTFQKVLDYTVLSATNRCVLAHMSALEYKCASKLQAWSCKCISLNPRTDYIMGWQQSGTETWTRWQLWHDNFTLIYTLAYSKLRLFTITF